MSEPSKDSGSTSAPPAPSGSPPEAYFEVKAEPARATLLVKSSLIKDGIMLTRDHISKKLQELKIVHGIDLTMVDNVLANKLYDRTHVIAVATPAKPGRDAYIEEKIKIDPDVKPVVGKDGKADYRNVDNIHQVKKGDVLAVKFPAVHGQSGSDIFGKLTPLQPAKDVQFRMGSNTEVTSDGLQLVASTGGYVFHQAGTICVGVTFVLKGNVDYKTGNLHYQGDICVVGNVTDGFAVEAEGNITVEGNVDAADIVSRNGSVTVKQGVFGHGKGRIVAKKDIHIQSAQDIKLECEETLIVDKAMVNCHAVAKDVKADKAGATVVGGTIKAYQNVAVAVMGAEGCRTEVHIVDKEAEANKLRLAEVEKQRTLLGPKLELVEKRLTGMRAMAKKMGGDLTERARTDLKNVLEVFAAVKKALTDLEAEKLRLVTNLYSTTRHTGKFTITEKSISGGYLDLYGHIRELNMEDAKKEWVWVADGLYPRTIIPETKAPAKPAPPAG